jgi:hypothetical protein
LYPGFFWLVVLFFLENIVLLVRFHFTAFLLPFAFLSSSSAALLRIFCSVKFYMKNLTKFFFLFVIFDFSPLLAAEDVSLLEEREFPN